MTIKYKALRLRQNHDIFMRTVMADGPYARSVNLADGSACAVNLYPVEVEDAQIVAEVDGTEDFDPVAWEVVTIEITVPAA